MANGCNKQYVCNNTMSLLLKDEPSKKSLMLFSKSLYIMPEEIMRIGKTLNVSFNCHQE